ncbi:hypothetical protein H0H81_003164 [Sphagnurus paluster]|uniref:NudC domain-containing protein 1 n=1 Tax=Sphagnurus paluster TaxID=117069 RepID=A0A9P7KJQ4_9AGAR|nr:hypothetical protein H0H81_003164 [Sphagnurus paluster]
MRITLLKRLVLPPHTLVMDTFMPSRSLLNPKFEGYKLDPMSQEDMVIRSPLEFKPTQATISGKSSFSFQEVQSRITHNHLAVCSESARALYVDSESKVVLIDIDAATLSPSFRVIFELPVIVPSNDLPPRNREYPSAVFISPAAVFVSDGYGLLYALQIQEGRSSKVAGVFSLPDASSRAPFRIHSVHKTSSTLLVAILSSRHYGIEGEVRLQSRERGRSTTDFDIWGVKVDLAGAPSNDAHQLQVLWHRRGQEVPIYTAHCESLEAFLLIGGTRYQEVGHTSAPSYEPSLDEIAPIPRADETFDVDAPEPLKPPPYSWTQSSDSLTIAIPLPSNTLKSQIKILFSPQALTVHVDSQVSTSIPIPCYPAKKLWDTILPSSSYWTWDREAEHSFGLLTLYLDKQHDGTKWPQVFASMNNSEDVDVLETLDPSELWKVREALEKYTTALRDGDDASGLGLGHGVPSLAEGEIDMEVDEVVGRTAYLNWVAENGSIPVWWQTVEGIPFQLLSTPIPGDTEGISLIIKNNLDGIVFSLESQNTAIPAWTHISTFSALSFVLASKQDTRFTFHTSKAVFAFEGGVRDRGGNVYIYRSAPSNMKWANQGILKVGDGYGGSLLGIGVLQWGSFSVILCLTEGELVLIKNP